MTFKKKSKFHECNKNMSRVYFKKKRVFIIILSAFIYHGGGIAEIMKNQIRGMRWGHRGKIAQRIALIIFIQTA